MYMFQRSNQFTVGEKRSSGLQGKGVRMREDMWPKLISTGETILITSCGRMQRYALFSRSVNFSVSPGLRAPGLGIPFCWPKCCLAIQMLRILRAQYISWTVGYESITDWYWAVFSHINHCNYWTKPTIGYYPLCKMSRTVQKVIIIIIIIYVCCTLFFFLSSWFVTNTFFHIS